MLRNRSPSQHDLVRENATRYRTGGRKSYRYKLENQKWLRKLPCLASSVLGRGLRYEWNPTLQTILEGVHDEESTLHVLCGKEAALVENIFSFVASKWGNAVTLTLPAHAIGRIQYWLPPPEPEILKFDQPYPRHVKLSELQTDQESGKPLQGVVSFVPITTIQKFPEPKDRDVNMLPFIFGDKDSLPVGLQCYHELIEQCPYMDEEVGKVGYLTVHESYVDADAAQRREGLHIETPGAFGTTSHDDGPSSMFSAGPEHHWGTGRFYGPDRLEGGIYMASTISDTSQVWDALVDKNRKGIVDHHGGCEHLRPLLGPGHKLQANQLIWMTDCTPHEALPQTESGYRQFFRVVTSTISHWFADHSTPNPNVPLPEDVIVVHGNKFAD